MSESVVADFVGRFHTADVDGDEPVRGRILLSQRRLVLVADGAKTTVPLSTVFDVSVGVVPKELQEFFSDTVTVAYREGDGRRVAVVEGGEENVGRFTTVLFKALLHRTTATVRHPAKVGGRVTDAPARSARLRLSEGCIGFVGPEDAFEVDLATVTHVERGERELDGRVRPVLSFRHMPEGRAVTSLVAVGSPRKLNVLGRYIRLEYGAVMESVRDVECTAEEMEALVALYSAGGGVRLGQLINADAAQITMILNSLREQGLVVDGEDATRLTPKGQVVVSERLERVNA